MILKYEIAMDDLVEFARYHARHSPASKKNRLVNLVFFPSLIMGAAFLLPENAWFTRGHYVACGIGMAAFYCLLLCQADFDADNVRRSYGEDCEKHLGAMELEIDPERITHRKREMGESSIPWKAINKIVENDGYVFVYATSNSAIVIPKNSITAGALERFVEEAKKYWGAANPYRSIET